MLVNLHLGAVGDEDEVIIFWGGKIKGHGHNKNKWGQKSRVQKSTFPENVLVDGSPSMTI